MKWNELMMKSWSIPFLSPQKSIKLRLLKLLCIILASVICMLFFISRHGEMFVYRQIINGDYVSAYRYTNALLNIIALTHGSSSERYSSVAVAISREFTLRTPYFLPASEKGGFALSKLASSLKDNDRSAEIFIESGRLANMSFRPDAARIFSTNALDRLRNKKGDIYEEAIIERSYAHLISFAEPLEKLKDWQELALHDFLRANAVICTRDVRKCRFNEVRWSIGICIREMAIYKRTSCIQGELMERLNRKKICLGLNDDQCQALLKDIAPYLFHLVSITPIK